jgi:hypothetical protein
MDVDLQTCPRCGYLIIAHDPADPVPEGHQRVANLRIDQVYAALMSMSRMALPNDRAENKVAVLLKKFLEIPFQILEQRRKRMYERLAPTNGEITPWLAEQRQFELTEIMNDTQDIPIFPSKIKFLKLDFPKEGQGLALIKMYLASASLYDLDEDYS